MQYTNMIVDCYDEQDFLTKFMRPGVLSILDKLKDDKLVSEILESVKNEAKKQMVDNNVLPSLSVLAIVATK